MLLSLSALGPLSYLLIAVVDDLVYKKFHNWLFVTLMAVALMTIAWTGFLPWSQAFLGLAMGCGFFLPLTVMGIVGAGDLKFMMCFGLLLGPVGTLQVSLLSLFWGAFLGTLKLAFSGELKTVLITVAAHRRKLPADKKNAIPYTVAILLAWLSWQMGVILW